jgi:transcriptional regulator GlxA family with amidase domain
LDPARCWSLEELAGQAHVSARHLARLFAEHAGISVVGYQQRLRVARARELLADRQLSIGRVAELAGFASARDFRRVWQRHEGGAPSAQRATAGPQGHGGRRRRAASDAPMNQKSRSDSRLRRRDAG